MRIYIQGSSALEHYRSTSVYRHVERHPLDVCRLEQATSSLAQFEESVFVRLGIEEPSPDHPLEVLVADPNLRNRVPSVHARVWSKQLPDNALRKVRKNIYVSSPEFLFLQMATKLDLASLVALGMELCGTYRRKVKVQHLGTNEVSHVTEYEQPSLTTPKRLRGFLGAMSFVPGRKKALSALDYVVADSASPMETAIYLLLCLPRHLGGYGLPLPVLNVSHELSDSAQRFTWRHSARPDLYWKKARLDLEYNSDEFHAEERRTEDSMRRKALEDEGIEVIELTRKEVTSEALFHATALRIARKLGKKVRSQYAGDFLLRRAELRELLLRDGDDASDGPDGGFRNADDPDEIEYVPVVDGQESC